VRKGERRGAGSLFFMLPAADPPRGTLVLSVWERTTDALRT
jgi:hypothetical protein